MFPAGQMLPQGATRLRQSARFLFRLMDDQIERLLLFFPKRHGPPRGDDRRLRSGIMFVNRNGLLWRDAR
ncbi:hypothetical protein CA234_06905 [Sphingomonas sp. ABOLE]|nr:hypothetical protein CA234_06905 [Sphingomonas sp. ABOLE]